MRDRNEIQLLDEINGRQVKAYHILYDEYYPALVAYAASFTLSDEVAEDIVQELFITMWEKHVTFPSFLSFKTYLYKYVKNASLDYLKHQDVEGRYTDYIRAFSDDAEMDEDEMICEEDYRLLFRAIDELPERCREIFLLSLQGCKNKDIAQQLSVSVETVKTQKMRAMKHLQDKMKLLFYFLLSASAMVR